VIAYVDWSVVLRIVFREPDPLEEWSLLTVAVTSTLLRVEAWRAIERETVLRVRTDETLREKRNELADVLSRLTYVPVDEDLLQEAAQAFPTVVGTLDALHLATALVYRYAQPPEQPPLLFATHDAQRARAARAMHFEVIGA